MIPLFFGSTEAQGAVLFVSLAPDFESTIFPVGFFTELGPFHTNDDGGQTLYENVFAWNRKANVIFLEAPVEVGFSYTKDTNYTWNDVTVALYL